jgi:hypothetical protein
LPAPLAAPLIQWFVESSDQSMADAMASASPSRPSGCMDPDASHQTRVAILLVTLAAMGGAHHDAGNYDELGNMSI